MRQLAKVGLPQSHAAAELRQSLTRIRDRIGILVQPEHIRAGLQNQLRVTAAAASAINDQCARARREQLDDFMAEHRLMISVVLHDWRLLFDFERTGCEPDRPLE